LLYRGEFEEDSGVGIKIDFGGVTESGDSDLFGRSFVVDGVGGGG